VNNRENDNRQLLINDAVAQRGNCGLQLKQNSRVKVANSHQKSAAKSRIGRL